MKDKNILFYFGFTILAFSSISHSKELNHKNPEGFKQFRLDYAKMIDITNDARLKHRNFYRASSTGPNKDWFDAVKQGNLDAVKNMVKKGQNIEVKDEAALGQTALGWAAFIGYEDMVDYLVAQKANLWATDRGDVYNVLKSSVLGKNVKVVKKIHNLMKDEVDLNNQEIEDDGETLIMVAASNGRLDVVEYLIEQKADLNRVTTTQNKTLPSYNQSALSYACSRGLSDMVELLSNHGAINHLTGKATCQ